VGGDPVVEPIFKLAQAGKTVEESQRPRPPDKVETLVDRGRAAQHLLLPCNKPHLGQYIIQCQVVLGQPVRNGMPGGDGDLLTGKRLHETGRFLSKPAIPIVNEQGQVYHGVSETGMGRKMVKVLPEP